MKKTTINSDSAFFPTTPPGFSWNYGDFAMRLNESGVNVRHADRTLILKLSDGSDGKIKTSVEFENKRKFRITFNFFQHKFEGNFRKKSNFFAV